MRLAVACLVLTLFTAAHGFLPTLSRPSIVSPPSQGDHHHALSAEGGPSGFNLRYPDDPNRKPELLDPNAQQRAWEKEYKDYLKRNGPQLCGLSWKGYMTYGRGAIFGREVSQGDSEADKYRASPSMYVEKAKWEESSGGVTGQVEDEDNLREILKRIETYDPDRQFVVVFQAAGLMGADIVTPNVRPEEMAARMDQPPDVVDVTSRPA